MVSWFNNRRYGPIGIDIGTRSVKLMQFSADQARLIDAVRWELPAEFDPADRAAHIAEAIGQAREGRKFRGRDAVLSLAAPQLFVQNIRVAKPPDGDLERTVRQEAAGRLPFAASEAEVRFLDAADVRQGDLTKREVIVLACHKSVVEKMLDIADRASLRAVALDAEPTALLRSYVKQFRRDEDREQRAMFAHIGATNSVVVIARGAEVLFVKYIDLGGLHMDEAVATHLNMPRSEAAMLRRHNGDRRADQQDPDLARSLAASIRPIIERLANELSLCMRYHSVTFRGQPLMRLVLGGGEATPALLDELAARVDLRCELGDPLRSFSAVVPGGRHAQWDVAAGLALRELN